jgi:hypothetical protein
MATGNTLTWIWLRKNPGRFGCYYGKNAGNCNPKGKSGEDMPG